MRKVITYGTFDLLHQGHINILKRAKALGDYLIVGVTTDHYDKNRGKLNVQRSLVERIEDVRSTGLADEIIIEELEGQKIEDILKYDVDRFVIGSDWVGKFDYLNEYCEVIYLERTKGISSTQIRTENSVTLRMGVIGSGRIAGRFITESKYVSRVEIVGVYNPRVESAERFSNTHSLEFATDNLEEFFSKTDVVYIASPHGTHYQYVKESLLRDKHVLCEKPISLSQAEAEELYALASERGLVLLEAIKTAYSPGFSHLCNVAKSGAIGKILDVEASFTTLRSGTIRELDPKCDGGSINELASYPALAIVKLLGLNTQDIRFYTRVRNGIDEFTKCVMQYPKATASFKVGLCAKTEGDLVITGTKGYIYVPAPWWKTSYFEVRSEHQVQTQRYFDNFSGDGLRYELHEFITMINAETKTNYRLRPNESIKIAEIIDLFNKRSNTFDI
ncbi:MAG: Gfo/Idh/MocA family oxidoreductase [Rikenellaceae bacterium]